MCPKDNSFCVKEYSFTLNEKLKQKFLPTQREEFAKMMEVKE